MTAGDAVLFTVVLLALLAGWALVRRYQRARDTFDVLSTGPAVQAPAPLVVILPDGFTCLRCSENPALPDRIWCAVCAPIVDALPAEPIEHGELEKCIARHPAGKRLEAGEDR